MPQTIRVADPAAPEITLYKVKEHGQSVGTIAMVTRDRISAPTAISWLLSDLSFLGPGEHISRYIVQGHVLTLQRNECIRQMEGDWIIFVDDDMTWQPDAFRKLVETQREHDLDMVGGLCFQRGEPHQPTMYMRERPTSGRYIFLEDWERGAVVEVDATGMAFVLITRRLLERMAGDFPSLEERRAWPRPPAYFRWDEKGYGEDFTFCQDVKLAGGKIFVNTGIPVGHIAEFTVTEEHFLNSLAQRSPELLEQRRKANDVMGLPTLEPEQAFDRMLELRGRG